MADLKETAVWEPTIRQLETSDPVMGGENGVSNTAPRQLANRTFWLKTSLAAAVADIGNLSTGKANKANSLAGYGITNAYTKTEADNLLINKADKTIKINAGNGLQGSGDLNKDITISLAPPSKISATSTNSASANTHSHFIDKASTELAGIVQLVDDLASGDTDKALTANQGRVLETTRMAGLVASSTEDPNTTKSTAILTSHANKPAGSSANCYIITWHFSKLGETSRFQIAVDNSTNVITSPKMWLRHTSGTSGQWSPWGSIDQENVVLKSTQVLAGNGMQGGGVLDKDITVAMGNPSSITSDSTNALGPQTHTHFIDKASTAVAGIVQLEDNLISGSVINALTANQGRVLRTTRMAGLIASSTEDPNTTKETAIVTNHANKPAGSATNCYILTWHFSQLGTTSRFQIAIDNSTNVGAAPTMWLRHTSGESGVWSPWTIVNKALQNMRLGASTTAAGVGHVMTDVNTWKPLQKLLDTGTWVTITG